MGRVGPPNLGPPLPHLNTLDMALDPDRYFAETTPGAHEWWYFDAIAHDGRDALVIVWYAALPFDPAYGLAARRSLEGASPHPLDHCAIGLSWYRDGKTQAYALNAFRRGDFDHAPDPFTVRVERNLLVRDARGYHLNVQTPAVDGRRAIVADLRFTPAIGTVPLERDLGGPGRPHRWLLAAADCQVAGRVQIEGTPSLEFAGRGYHDHNAGAEEIAQAMRGWRWGRAHAGQLTQVYYHAEPREGASHSLWITCRDGRPEEVRDRPAFDLGDWRWNPYGLRSARRVTVAGSLRTEMGPLVDDGPFYQRWLSRSRWPGQEEMVPGLGEWVLPENLHRPWFRWMVPYRLKRPGEKRRGLVSVVKGFSRLF